MLATPGHYVDAVIRLDHLKKMELFSLSEEVGIPAGDSATKESRRVHKTDPIDESVEPKTID